MPFVQGRLREELLSFVIETECAHCHKPIQIEIDSEMHYRVIGSGTEPLVYVPIVDVQALEAPSIIDGF
jgi:hypothetical protein